MAVFRFRLQGALDRAAHLEELAALALAKLVREEEEAREVLCLAWDDSEQKAAELTRSQVGEVDLAEIQGRRRHLEAAWARVEELREVLCCAQEDSKRKRAELVRVRQEREKLERLREGKLVEHRRELLAEEGRVMEELSRLVFSRGGEG